VTTRDHRWFQSHHEVCILPLYALPGYLTVFVLCEEGRAIATLPETGKTDGVAVTCVLAGPGDGGLGNFV